MKNEQLSVSDLKQAIADTPRGQAEAAACQDKARTETRKAIKETNRGLESFGVVQGEIAEDLFRRRVKDLLQKQNILVDEVIASSKRTEERKHDIATINRTRAVVFEIKNKPRYSDDGKLRRQTAAEF